MEEGEQAVFHDLASGLADAARQFYGRGWLFATSGNLSAVCRTQPLELAVTPTGVDKGRLDPADILKVDAASRVLAGDGRPSSELSLHLAIVAARGAGGAGAVFHTHSTAATLLSRQTAGTGGIDLTGYEMLKGLSGVESHLHRERLPVLPNDQDRRALAGAVAELLEGDRTLHGFLLEAHGLYTWGRDLSEARRHLEVLEFLLEVESRLPDAGFRPGGA